MLDSGRHLQMSFEPHQVESQLETVNEFRDWMDPTLMEAKSTLVKAKGDMVQYYNQCQTLAPEYQVRDKVCLDASDICTTCPLQNLAHHSLSPFMIVWKVGWNTYWLHLLTSMSRLHPIFNVIKLLPTPSDPIPGQKASPPPLPEIVDGEEHYVVEWILDSQFMRGHLQFLMKWEGYGYEENPWVSEQDVTAPDKLHKFYQIHPGALHWIHSLAFQSLMSHALRMQHARRGVMSGDAPSHTSAVPDSTPPLGQNSTLLPFLNSAPPSSWSSAPLSLLELLWM